MPTLWPPACQANEVIDVSLLYFNAEFLYEGVVFKRKELDIFVSLCLLSDLPRFGSRPYYVSIDTVLKVVLNR